MENIALIDSFSEFKDDKLIDRVTLMAILEDVFRNALKKKYGSDDNFDIIINIDKGDFEIWRNREVVEDDELEDPALQIPLSKAKEIDNDYEAGEDVPQEAIRHIFTLVGGDKGKGKGYKGYSKGGDKGGGKGKGGGLGEGGARVSAWVGGGGELAWLKGLRTIGQVGVLAYQNPTCPMVISRVVRCGVHSRWGGGVAQRVPYHRAICGFGVPKA